MTNDDKESGTPIFFCTKLLEGKEGADFAENWWECGSYGSVGFFGGFRTVWDFYDAIWGLGKIAILGRPWNSPLAP